MDELIFGRRKRFNAVDHTGPQCCLRDSGEAQRLIRTMPRRGLRFVGEVYEQQSSTAPGPVLPAELPEPQTISQARGAERRQVTVFARDFLGGGGNLVFDMASFVADTRLAREFVGLPSDVTASDAQKTNENMLSMDVVKKADEIEKLAHSVKDKMKGN